VTIDPELRCYRPLVALIDLDHEPFGRERGLAMTDHDVALFRELHRAHVHVLFASGLPRARIEPLRARLPSAWWFAEHGAARLAGGSWISPPTRRELDELASLLAPLTSKAELERTSVSLRISWGDVEIAEAAAHAFAGWLLRYPTYRLIASERSLEARLGTAHKSAAVPWTRQRLPGVRFMVVGLPDSEHLDARDVRLSAETARQTLGSLAELRVIEYPEAPRPAAEPLPIRRGLRRRR
jgi:hypothetical protein